MSIRDNSPEGQRNRQKLVKEALENWKKEQPESTPVIEQKEETGTRKQLLELLVSLLPEFITEEQANTIGGKRIFEVIDKLYLGAPESKQLTPKTLTDAEIEKEAEGRYPVNTHSNPNNSPYVGTKKTFIHGVNWAISRLTPNDGWISVEDRLPEINVEVIIALKNDPETETGFYSPDELENTIQWARAKNAPSDWALDVTHWMPLPNPPKS